MTENNSKSNIKDYVTSFTVYDKYNHLCPFDTGLIDKGIKLYFSGYIKTIDDEDHSVSNATFVPKMGPIREWWIYAYDGGELSLIGLTTDHAMYYLVKPSCCYKHIFLPVQEKADLSKTVIEFLIDFAWQNPKFEDLIQHLKNFQQFQEVEESLLRHAQFLCKQILSYDEETIDEEIPMISLPCIQTLIELTGATLNMQDVKKSVKALKKKDTTISVKATTTNLVEDVFKYCLPDCDQHNSNEEMQNFGGCGKLQSKLQGCENNVEDRYSSANEKGELGDKPVKHKVCSKKILHSVEWLKKSTVKYNGCQGYSSAKVENHFYLETYRAVPKYKPRPEPPLENEDFVIQQGDYVILHAETSKEPLRIAKVSYMYDSALDGAMIHAHFFCRGTDTILGQTADPRELFVVDDCDDYPLGCIVRKAEVEFKRNPQNWADLGSTLRLPLQLEDNGRDYFFSKIYDYEFSRFRDYHEDTLDLDDPCTSCRWQRNLEINKTPIYKDDCILWRKEIFKIGTAVFLEPGQLKCIPATSVEEKENNVCNQLHPEMYRRSTDKNKGSNADTPEPLTVGLIEDIKNQKSSIQIKVRMFYRPEDTRGAPFCTYTKDINYLYWTDHVKWTTFKYVRRKCYISFSDDIELAKEWSRKGPFRFYYLKAYDHKNLQIYEVPLKGKIFCPWLRNSRKLYELRSTKRNLEENTPKWDGLNRPLRCMDIYAGCGGLSEGLHQAGAAKTLWAIEKETAPAQAFQLNNPECHVYTDDCNNILNVILNGAGKDAGLPDRGDVELLVGGPPCQGFSAMNRFNSGQSSYLKNSQIITFLGYCDYYRCLLAMGYQISFGIVQAGNFGIPQTRRRFILMGAAPGCTLPKLPEPLHVFSESFLSIVVDGLRYDTGSPWTKSLPYRTICVRDAIADLPEIKNGSLKMEMPYDEKAQSHFQKNARKMNKNGIVKDHTCKEMSLLVEARISHIPTNPGADWRDLPNKVVRLKDGSLTNILKYSYRTKNQPKGDTPRGVCRCVTGNKCDPSDKQSNTLIPWCLSHTADRHNHWVAVYGRLEWDGFFGTTVTNPEPMGTQGRVLHPEQNRVVSVRECARSQGFHDGYKFDGNILDKHRQIGNAVPPPLALALGREIIRACNSTDTSY